MRLAYIVTIAAVGAVGLAAPRVNEARTTSPLSAYRLPHAPDGKALYLKECKQCHGVLGAPPQTMRHKYDKIPDFTQADFFKDHPDTELLDAITNGKGRDMKSFSDRMEKDEIEAVLAFIHTLVKT